MNCYNSKDLSFYKMKIPAKETQTLQIAGIINKHTKACKIYLIFLLNIISVFFIAFTLK